MSVDILSDVPFTDAYLKENCRQCRKEDANGESVFDGEDCIDQVQYEPLSRDEPVYRTTDDGVCWNKDTYDGWIKPRGTNPRTRNPISTAETAAVTQTGGDEALTNAFRDACANGRVDAVQHLLLDGRVDPAAARNEAIRTAAENGHAEVVRLLLTDARVDPAALRNVAIQVAAYYGHTDVVTLLLADARVDPADRNNVAILIAAEGGHADVVRLLFEDGRVGDPVAFRNRAADRGYAEVLRILEHA